ncbi:unnamed protein product [Oikopleura dioica]|uniref:Uncharacterized protein n=1 Tax=Oikopleura dioica TaxID=34765 RepID=E4WYD7_OIKDI|nr:unnamed protein product [Oikopleura dioica]
MQFQLISRNRRIRAHTRKSLNSYLFSKRPQFDDPYSIDEDFVRRVRQSHLDREDSEAREHLRLQDLANFDPEDLSGSDTGMFCSDNEGDLEDDTDEEEGDSGGDSDGDEEEEFEEDEEDDEENIEEELIEQIEMEMDDAGDDFDDGGSNNLMDDDTNEGILDQEQGIRLIVKSFI